MIASLLLVSAGTQGRSAGIEKETIAGTVVAYDVGLQLSNGSCRQTIIVRTRKGINQTQENDYIIVRFEASCMKLIPERILKTAPQWKFSLTRNVNCDELLDELLYMKQLNPTGDVYRYPRVTFVPSAEGEKVPRDKKLRCYLLQPGGLEPPLKER